MTGINPVFRPFSRPARYKVAYGGRGSGKSWAIAELLIEISRRTSGIILCTRELQNSIADSVIQILENTIDRKGYQLEFEVQKTQIIHRVTGCKFLFYGLKSNITKIKSLEGVIVCWVEEAENVSFDSWEVLTPTVRREGSEIWVSFNPANILDDTYRRFITEPYKDLIPLKVNYMHNPHFPDVLRKEMEELKERDYDLYLHVWEGEPTADSEHAFIKPSWIAATVDAHKKLPDLDWFSGERRVGLDIADEGEDTNALTYSQGSVITDIQEWKKGDTAFTAQKAYNYADTEGANIVFDNIGVGAGCKAKFRELNENRSNVISCYGFNAGGKVMNPKKEYMKGTGKKNKDHYENLKAQSWGGVAQLFKNTYYAVTQGHVYPVSEMISLSSDMELIDKFKAELSRVQVDYSGNGKVMAESKKKLRDRGIPSPNLADSGIMARANCRPKVAGVS